MSGRTTIVISHNLLTVTDADQILFLDDGVITGAGTHQQLLGRHPGYTRLYRLHHPDHPDQDGAATATVARPGPAPDPLANSPTTGVPAVRPHRAAPDSTSVTTRLAQILPARPVKTLGRADPPPAAPPRTGRASGHDPTPTTSRLPTVTPADQDDPARTTGRHHAVGQSHPAVCRRAPRGPLQHQHFAGCPHRSRDHVPRNPLAPQPDYQQHPIPAQRDPLQRPSPGKPCHAAVTGPPPPTSPTNGHRR